MKILKLIVHPWTLIISFLFVMISGQHLGGFFILYLLLGLPFGAIHSFLALIGIIVLLVNHHYVKRPDQAILHFFLNFIGLCFLFFSLFTFFIRDIDRYNYNTFQQTFPLFTLIFTSIIASIFLIYNITKLIREFIAGHTFKNI